VNIIKPVQYEPHKKITKLMMKLERQHEEINPKRTITRRRIEKKYASLAYRLKWLLGV